jgi:hypothetical protein
MLLDYNPNSRIFVSCTDEKAGGTPSVGTNALVETSNQANGTVPLQQFVTNGDSYCSHGVGNVWCTVVALAK